MRVLTALALGLFLAAPAAAQQMNAEEFHRRASALKAKGPLALLQRGEIDALMIEGQNAGKAARARRVAAQAAGKPLPYCPPAGKTGLDANVFMTRLSAIPQGDRRRMTMTDATVRILAAEYPCAR